MKKNRTAKDAKKSVNLSINSDLLRKAQAIGINLSETLEIALIGITKERRREIWLAENKEAIAAYNAHVERYGVFSDGCRRF